MKKSEKFWRTFKYILLFALGVLAFMFNLEYKYLSEKVTHCGTIVAKSSDITQHKYRTTENLYFIVDYKQYGQQRVNPTEVDYFNFKVGNTVCYEYNRAWETNSENKQFFIFVFLVFCAVIYGFLVIFYIADNAGRWINKFNKWLDNESDDNRSQTK